jgi:molecular chaperone GrpE
MAKLAKELLPALDHLDLALRAAEEHGGGEFAKGIRQIQDELVAALGRAGIQAYSPKGEPFDPAEHEAMASQPVEGAEAGTVTEVYQQGYRINGTVLRPARVVVAA